MKLKIVILLMIYVFLSGCSTQIPITATQTEPITNTPSEMVQPTSSVINIPDQETEVLSYEVLSPASILTKTGVLIEINSASIAVFTSQETTFRFGLSFTGLSEDQIPEHSPEDSSFLIEDVQFFRGEEEAPLEVEKFGGGGGGGPQEDELISVNQSETYRLSSDFAVGQLEHIIALVTFNATLGISEPVRFDLEIIPQEGPLG